MRIIGNNPAADNAEITAVASGTLPSGKPVVVNADGTVSVVAEVTLTEAKGSIVQFEAGVASNQGIVYDSNSDRIVIFYKDENNSNFGTAIVSTVSGDSISFGTPVVFESANTTICTPVFDSSNNKIAIAYNDGGNSGAGTAIVGTVDPSDNSISFGSAVVFESGNSNNSMGISFDTSANKVVIAFRDNGDSNYGKAIVGTVSGTGISFGTAATFSTANTMYISMAYDIANNKHVIGYVATSGNAKVATVSGTSISFGSAVEFESGATILTKVVNDPNINRVHIFYADGGDNDKGKAVIGSVSGTGISFTAPTNFYTAAQVVNIGVSFNSSINAITAATRDNGGNLNMFTITSTTTAYTVGSAFSIDTGILNGNVNNAHVSTADRTVLAFTDSADSSKGKAVVYTGSGVVKNLTAENFIGFAGGAVGVTETLSEAIGTPVVFEAGLNTYNAAAFDSNSNKVVICYNEELEDNSNLGTAIVGTVDPSNNSISFGTAVVFENAMADYISVVFDSNSNKVVISYRDLGNSAYGTAIVGTVSGTGISFGTAVVFESAGAPHISSTFDSNSNKVVISYADAGNSYVGTAIVGTVSGTNISFGTAVVFENAITTNTSTTFDSSLSKVVISYRDQANSGYGTAIVGTVSGTGISFGSATVFEAADSTTISSASGGNSKVVITYRDNGNSYYGTAIVGTVSGTSISFGTAVVFNATTTTETSCLFNSALSTFVVTYEDYASGEHGKVVVGTVSGTGISFGSASVFENANIEDLASTFDSNSNRVVLAYKDSPNSQYGTAVVVRNAGVYPVTVQVASGDNAVIDIGSAISTNQSGLTAGQQYFVQTDGTLGLTAADPSVIAGTAVSATDIIVKG